MSRLSEPCLCGAPDCRYCFPSSWRENELYEKYCDESNGESFDEWLTEYNTCEAEEKYDRLQDREDDRFDRLFNEGIN